MGHRHPTNSKATFAMMDNLAKRKRIPKKKRYAKGSRRQEVTDNG